MKTPERGKGVPFPPPRAPPPTTGLAWPTFGVNGEAPARADPNGKLPPWYPKPPWKRGDGGSTLCLATLFPKAIASAIARQARPSAGIAWPTFSVNDEAPARADPRGKSQPWCPNPPGSGGMGGRPPPSLAALFPRCTASAIARQGGPPRETSIPMLLALAATLPLDSARAVIRRRDFSLCPSIPSHRNGARKPPWRGGLGGRPLNPKRE